jgi:hypothetical protein
LTFKIFLYIKIVVILSIIFQVCFLTKKLKNYYKDFYDNYRKINRNLNFTFYKNIKEKKKINIAIYALGIKNGGRARITSLLLNYLKEVKVLDLYLFTKVDKEDNEYFIPKNIKRIHIKNNLINEIKKNKIDILIYQLSFSNEIRILNNVNNVKILFYQHLGIFDWIYGNYSIFKSLYGEYINSKYVVNIIPFENDYLFKKWGINSILMNNFITYNFSKIIPSDLSSNRILMIGRGDAKKKRFIMGILAFEYLVQEIPKCELIIISDFKGTFKIQYLMKNINLENNIKLMGYTSTPEIFFKNASFNMFPSISEAFPLVICETKIYGIPNVLLGLDYTTISDGGTMIIYDETPESLAKSSLDILKSYEFRNYLGIKARDSMKIYNNDLLIKKWIKLILSIYNGEYYYEKIKKNNGEMSQLKSLQIIKNQIILLEKRISIFKNIKINDIENFTFMKNINID